MKIQTLALFCTMTLLVRAEDWTTTDGKTYHNVTVVKVEGNNVVISSPDFNGSIPFDKLPVGLQQRFHHDPLRAKDPSADLATPPNSSGDSLQNDKLSMSPSAPLTPVSLTPGGPDPIRDKKIALQSQIDTLKADIKIMADEDSKLSLDPDASTKKEVTEKQIADKKAQIAKLQAQLNTN
jgi:hypothetical protein